MFLYSAVKIDLFPISSFCTRLRESLCLDRYLVEHNEAVRVRVQAEATSALGITRQDADVVESVGRQVLQCVGVLGRGDLVGVEAGEVREIIVLDLILRDHRASVGLSHAASACGCNRALRDAAGTDLRIEPAPMGLARDNDLPVLDWMPTSKGLTDVRHVLREWIGRVAGA